MALQRIKLNSKGIRALLKEPRVQADLTRRARNISAAAGPGHRVESSPGKNRARAVVVTDTMEARANEARSRRLTRAIDAGRR